MMIVCSNVILAVAALWLVFMLLKMCFPRGATWLDVVMLVGLVLVAVLVRLVPLIDAASRSHAICGGAA